MSCIIKIIYQRCFVKPLYDINKLSVYFIDQTGEKVSSFKLETQVIVFPILEIANLDKNRINERIQTKAAALAAAAGFYGVVMIDVLTKSAFKCEKNDRLNFIRISMFYSTEEFYPDQNPYPDLPQEVDLCDYYPNASVENMKICL